MTALSELLIRNLPEGWNGKRLAEEAERRGYVLHRATAADYLRGRHARHPDELTLRAFGEALSIPLADLRAAVDLPTINEPFELPPEADRLTNPQRDALRHVISVMLNPGKESERHGDAPATKTPGDELANRRGETESPARKAAHTPRPGTPRRGKPKTTTKDHEGEEGKGS